MMKRFVMVPYEQFIKKEKLENNNKMSEGKRLDEITAIATAPTSAVGNDDADQPHSDSAGGHDRGRCTCILC
jgi:hypothetical protein